MTTCIPKGGQGYDDARSLQNARFDLYPAEICFCDSEPDVQKHLEGARPGFVRIRSGRHHHEGMCSGTDVRIIDVSKINHLSIQDDVLTVGPGAKLRDIYKALWKTRRLLPGGGCPDVCIGGLAQGGGWGLYSRSLGLTCDRLIGFRMVRANRNILDVTKGDTQHKELFKAVCGGGGGNFGVITEFRFRLARLESEIWSFTVNWADMKDNFDVFTDWRVNFPNNPDRRLTSFLRYTVPGGAIDDKPIVLAGNYLGTKKETESALIRQLPTAWSKKAGDPAYDQVDLVSDGVQVFQHPEYQPGPPMEALRALPEHAGLADEELRDLGSTCAGIPYPHKISSCYPNLAFIRGGISTMYTYLTKPGSEPTARRYLSLHGMGGAVKDANDWSSYAFRHYDYLLQYQAWWANKNQKDVEERCIAWVEGFRDTLQPWTEYSFINFPDHKIKIKEYYGTSFADLIEVKKTYDRDGLFDFPMGIPRQ